MKNEKKKLTFADDTTPSATIAQWLAKVIDRESREQFSLGVDYA